MFRAPLCPSSGAQEYLLYRWLLLVVYGALVFKLLVWCGAEGYVSGLQDAALLPVVFGALVFKLLVWCGAEGYVSGFYTD